MIFQTNNIWFPSAVFSLLRWTNHKACFYSWSGDRLANNLSAPTPASPTNRTNNQPTHITHPPTLDHLFSNLYHHPQRFKPRTAGPRTFWALDILGPNLPRIALPPHPLTCHSPPMIIYVFQSDNYLTKGAQTY